MLGTKFSPWPSYSEEEISSITDIMRSGRVNYWTGKEGREFEKEFAAWVDVPHAVALANGTLALDLCWKVLGIGSGDEVICTPRTFLASASSIINAGAVPVFADVDPDSQNITPQSATSHISPRTKAILCVHLAGWPCDMAGFRELANLYNLFLVEDCAQAHGATIKGQSVGGLSDIAAWSFCQDKIMTTGGEGGMITTHNKDLWSKAWSFKDHGKSWEAVYERQHPPGFRWLHESIGTNWRMMEFQATIGRIQLRKMSDWKRQRRSNAHHILAAAKELPTLRVPAVPNQVEHAYYKAYAFVRPETLKSDWSRDRIIDEIYARGVPCYQGSCSEVYLEKAFDSAPGRPAQRLAVAKKLGETSIMFLVHPTLTPNNIDQTVDVLKQVMKQAQK